MQLTFLAAALTVASSVTAIAIPNPLELDTRDNVLEKRATISTTGCRDGFSGRFRPYRQEINNFIKNADQLNLYLIGLEAMQKDSWTSPYSFYQLCAIHGRPYGSFNQEPMTGYPQSGYCTHASILFPTWHRPYLALYEQILHDKIQQLVNRWPTSSRTRWQNALNGWRMPYWDWATNGGQMPSIVGTQQTVTVTKWDNRQYTIANPLYSFKFPSGSNGQGPFPNAPFYSWSQTLRYPTSNNPGAVSQPNLVNQQLSQNFASLRQRVYHLLVDPEYRDYKTMSNKNANTGSTDSIESIHDTIHGLVGNGGHMAYVDYSSFDPIFWLHHTNIDRLFAIWQALNPNSFVSSQANPFGTYGVPVGTVETGSTPLTPFRRTNGALWNSYQIRATTDMGYAYPETGSWKYSTTASYQAAVRKSVQSLYGTTQASLATSASLGGNNKRRSDNETQVAVDASVSNNMYMDWKINVKINKMAAGGSFFIHFFLGKPSANPKDWSFQKNLIGDFVVFVNTMAMAPPCINGVCPPADDLITGDVPLTQALLNNIVDIGSLNTEDVVGYLKGNLTWTASLMNDSSISVTKLDQLEVTVLGRTAELPTDPTQFPEYGTFSPYYNVTENKVGGAS